VHVATFAGVQEGVLGEIVGVAALDRRRLARIENTIVVHAQWIVRVELRRTRPQCRDTSATDE
jgi:hypothetical protein